MLKKIIVSILGITVIAAVGTSIYNASAAPQFEAQAQAAPAIETQPPQAETQTASVVPALPAVSEPDSAQATMSQGVGDGWTSSGEYGSERGPRQGVQTGSAVGTHAGEATKSGTPGGKGQGASGASGRPAWAGGGQGK